MEKLLKVANFAFRSIIASASYKITVNIAIPGFSTQTLREGYAVISLRYDWPPKRGTSVGLAIGTPASRESELLRLQRDTLGSNMILDVVTDALSPLYPSNLPLELPVDNASQSSSFPSTYSGRSS